MTYIPLRNEQNRAECGYPEWKISCLLYMDDLKLLGRTEKTQLIKERFRSLKSVWDTELSAKNNIQAFGSLAVPVLRHIVGIFNWFQEELQKLDRKTRKLLYVRGHHTKTNTIAYIFLENREGLA
jgi:hypothetical protein